MAANQEQTVQGGLVRVGAALTKWTERWIPDALVIVFILSMIAFVLALVWGFKPEIAFGDRLSPSRLASAAPRRPR